MARALIVYGVGTDDARDAVGSRGNARIMTRQLARIGDMASGTALPEAIRP